MKKRILLIDDDIDMCGLLTRFLRRNGYSTTETYSGAAGIEKYKQEEFDIVICDYRLGDKNGKEVLEEILNYNEEAIVLIITGYADIQTAAELIKSGAYEYITKPLVPDEILNTLNDIAVDLSPSPGKSLKISKKTNPRNNDGFIAGESKQSKELYNQVEMVANTGYSVILYGEAGTGKEVIARTIHDMSRRRKKPFITLDCGTLSRELSASELFGHIKGAFNGALTDKEGHFELANGGTLFLDDVGNLSYETQASLLEVIKERKFKRVGGTKEIPFDVRLVVASHENLQDAYKKGTFREELYHRFNEFSINVPTLSQRKDDIPLFAGFFLQRTKAETGKLIQGFDEEVMECFLNYSWPGNLSELRTVIHRAALLTNYHKISIHSLPHEIIPSQSSGMRLHAFDHTGILKKDTRLNNSNDKAEYEIILNVLRQVNFNKSKAAGLLNIDSKTLHNKIRTYRGNSRSGSIEHK